MDVHVVLCNFLRTADYVQLVVSACAKPNMSSVLEGVWHSFQTKDALIESCTLLEIADMDSLVIKRCLLFRSARLWE